MEIKKSEATVALMAIDAAGARSTQLQRYRRFAPFLILWGAIWLLANSVSELAPSHSGAAWLSLSLLGAAVSYWLGRRQHAAFDLDSGSGPWARAGQGRRWALCFLVIVAFLTAAMAVLSPADARQEDTFATTACTAIIFCTWAASRAAR
jgi:hypothetical protein